MSDGFITRREGNGDSGGGVDPSIIERTATNITADMLKGVTSIGIYAFYYFLNLRSVTIPNSVTSIGSYAFNDCSSLESINIPSGITSIGDSTFKGCFGLTSIDLPDSLTSIDMEAFRNCEFLTSIEIPSSVTSIGGYAFSGCRSLKSVTVKATTQPTLGNNVFNNTHANLVIYVPAGSVDAYKSASGWSDYASKIQAIPSN